MKIFLLSVALLLSSSLYAETVPTFCQEFSATKADFFSMKGDFTEARKALQNTKGSEVFADVLDKKNNEEFKAALFKKRSEFGRYHAKSCHK